MSANFHPLVYIIDYILGIIMWTLVGRVAMNIFQREDSQFFFMKAFVKFTNPLLKIFKPLTPTFIIQPLVPLYVAWFFFHDKVLLNALCFRVFSYGNAFISTRK
jgi:uncharacterized protein YggT (Ycf19 family)